MDFARLRAAFVRCREMRCVHGALDVELARFYVKIFLYGAKADIFLYA